MPEPQKPNEEAKKNEEVTPETPMSEEKAKEMIEEFEQTEFKMASQESIDKVLVELEGVKDAMKELTKIVGELHAANIKWFAAGKM